MNGTSFNVGAFVRGAPTSARQLVRHSELLNAFAAGEIDDDGESYFSHFVFGPEMPTHYRANRSSVAGFAGPCVCRWLTLDIDRADLTQALDDARRLVRFIGERYPELHEETPTYFSGGKGFHVLIELVHEPPPAVGFHRFCRTFAETLAGRAGVKIDAGIYDVNHIVRLPNTRHPRTGLFKRRIEHEALFALSLDGIRDLAKRKDFTGLSGIGRPVRKLADDWAEAERETARQGDARAASRRDFAADLRAPRYFFDLLRFGVDEGERHSTLFRCSAWLTEQGAPPSLAFAVLTEPGRDVGLTPADVERQIRCGIEHARKQHGASEGGRGNASPPAPLADEYESQERWCIQHESDLLPDGALDFGFGGDEATGPYGNNGGRR